MNNRNGQASGNTAGQCGMHEMTIRNRPYSQSRHATRHMKLNSLAIVCGNKTNGPFIEASNIIKRLLCATSLLTTY